jgi:hypothetical protein
MEIAILRSAYVRIIETAMFDMGRNQAGRDAFTTDVETPNQNFSDPFKFERQSYGISFDITYKCRPVSERFLRPGGHLQRQNQRIEARNWFLNRGYSLASQRVPGPLQSTILRYFT